MAAPLKCRLISALAALNKKPLPVMTAYLRQCSQLIQNALNCWKTHKPRQMARNLPIFMRVLRISTPILLKPEHLPSWQGLALIMTPSNAPAMNSQVAGACVWPLVRSYSLNQTFCCWMSLQTILTLRARIGLSNF